MVFVAFLLLTASTLATHGKVVSPDGPIILRGYDQEPEDNPQEEINNYLPSHPAQVARMKRDVAMGLVGTDCEEAATWMPNLVEDDECNCKARIQCARPYQLHQGYDNKMISQAIVNSTFFDQKVLQVHCREPGAPCFKDVAGFKAVCEQKEIDTRVKFFDKLRKEVVEVKGIIYVDCACVKTN